MPSDQDGRAWNPYVAGALTGLLIVVSAAYNGNYFGASASFVRSAGVIERIFGPEHVAATKYFMRYAPRLDWQTLFLAGICLGAFVSALRSREFSWRSVPGMWEERFGAGVLLRAAAAFTGGFVILVGSRIAGG